MNLLPGEIVPQPVELIPYPGLKEIRFRRDGRLVVGLFITETDSSETVVTLASLEARTPFWFNVKPEDANQAFEGPWSYAPRAGQLIIEDILNPPHLGEVAA